MSDDTRRALEAILMVADTPTPTETLAGLVDTSGERVDSLLVELAADRRADWPSSTKRSIHGACSG